MRTALAWVLLGLAGIASWLGWALLLESPWWWIVAAVTSGAIAAVAGLVLRRRDLVTVALASGAGAAIGWSGVIVPDGGAGVLWTLAAVGVFVGVSVLAALAANAVISARNGSPRE